MMRIAIATVALILGLVPANAQAPGFDFETWEPPADMFNTPEPPAEVIDTHDPRDGKSYVCTGTARPYLLRTDGDTLIHRPSGQDEMGEQAVARNTYRIVARDDHGLIATRSDDRFPVVAVVAVNFVTGFYSFTTVQTATGFEEAGTAFGECRLG